MIKPLRSTLNLRYVTLTNEQYHADQSAVGSSSLKALASDGPDYAKAYHDGELRGASDAFALGGAVHAILDGTYLDSYSTAPIDRGYSSRTTKAFSQMQSDMRDSGDRRTLLTRDEASEAERLAQAILSVTAGSYVGQPTLREPSLYWEEPTDCGPLRCKCRPDVLIDDWRGGAILHDIKTSARIGPKHVKSAFWSFGYWIQQSHYEAGIRACGASQVDTAFIFVRKSKPYDVGVYRMSDDDRENARYQWRRLINEWARRTVENDWGNGTLLRPETVHLGIRGDETELEGFDDE